VLRSALQTLCPGAQVKSYLMMPDKSVKAAVSGLNQLFKIERTNGRSKVTASPLAKQVAHTPGLKPLLTLVPVDEYVDMVMQSGVRFMSFNAPLPQLATQWAEAYKLDAKIEPMPGKHCGKCEFKTRPQDGLLSGFEECWQQKYGLTPSQLAEGTVLDIYSFRRKDQLISDGLVLLRNAREAGNVIELNSARPDLSLSERQWMQVNGIPEEEDRGGFWMADEVMHQEMRTWHYPYHFIDFETSTVAIPFHKGMRPYEPVAFQFSHHVMQADGSVAHVGEFLMTDPVVFPNFEFARALRAELEGDGGTVFMWSPHENTILNKIVGQLEECLVGGSYGSGSEEGGTPNDALELIEFVRTLTKGGSRAMVDLCALSKRAYFADGIKGSSSIKKVLPSVMKWSGVLKGLYSGGVYGASIPSKNYKDFAWWVAGDDGVPLEPYDLLRLEGEDLLGEELRPGEDPDDLAITEGGAAASAYARLQFEDVDEVERRMIQEALLRYCELDTLAMVMIVQAWREGVGKAI
jgi:hypothetical protein